MKSSVIVVLTSKDAKTCCQALRTNFRSDKKNYLFSFRFSFFFYFFFIIFAVLLYAEQIVISYPPLARPWPWSDVNLRLPLDWVQCTPYFILSRLRREFHRRRNAHGISILYQGLTISHTHDLPDDQSSERPFPLSFLFVLRLLLFISMSMSCVN